MSFYERFDRKEQTKSIRDNLIKELFLEPFNREFGVKIKIKDLSQDDQTHFWHLILNFISVVDRLSLEEYSSYREDELQQKSLKVQNLNHDIYMASIREKLGLILIAAKELEQIEEGASTKDLKGSIEDARNSSEIFMRILKGKKLSVDTYKISTWNTSSLKFSSMLNRVYYASYNNKMDPGVWRFFFPYNDTTPEQKMLVVCMNHPLFGNYHRPDESTLFIYLQNCSIESGDSGVYTALEAFFSEIGLDPSLVETLKEIAERKLNAAGAYHGCILQFFDRSEAHGLTPYEGFDRTAYVSHSFGIPLKDVSPSMLALNAYPLRNKTMDLQYRLITTNNSTLNPYGFLRVVRHDGLDPELSDSIIEEMRAALRTSPVDQIKLNNYSKHKILF